MNTPTAHPIDRNLDLDHLAYLSEQLLEATLEKDTASMNDMAIELYSMVYPTSSRMLEPDEQLAYYQKQQEERTKKEEQEADIIIKKIAQLETLLEIFGGIVSSMPVRK